MEVHGVFAGNNGVNFTLVGPSSDRIWPGFGPWERPGGALRWETLVTLNVGLW